MFGGKRDFNGGEKRWERKRGRKEKGEEGKKRKILVLGLRFILYYFEFFTLIFFYVYCDFVNFSCFLQLYFSIHLFITFISFLFFSYFFGKIKSQISNNQKLIIKYRIQQKTITL